MPLNKAILEEELKKLLDSEYPGFTGFPETPVRVAEAWVNVIDNYTSSIIPVSANKAGARSAFITTASGIVSNPPNAISLLTAAFTAYATQLALGMQPLFTGTPPPTPVPIATIVPLGLSGVSGSVIAIILSRIIDTWFRTGIAINNSSGTTVIWN